MVVIGIFLGIMLPRISWIDSETATEETLKEFVTRLELARDEAVLQGRNIGIRFYTDRYAFLDLDPDSGAWLGIEGDDLLSEQALGDDILIQLTIEGQTIELEPTDDEQDSDDEDQQFDAFGQPIATAGLLPHIVLLASGESTPFELTIERLGGDEFKRLEADFLGRLSQGEPAP